MNSDTLQSVVMFFLVFAAVFMVLGLIARRIKVEFVEQGHEAVLYRMGRFTKLKGPGPVFLVRGSEEIHQTLDVREDWRSYQVSQFVDGVPVTLTFDVRCRTDPREAALRSGIPLEKLVVYTDRDRERQIQPLVRSAFRKAFAQVSQEKRRADAAAVNEQPQPAPTLAKSRSPFLDALIIILPGFEWSNRIMDLMTRDLQESALETGVVLSSNHPIMIARIALAPDLAQGFSRNRTIDLLREKFPNMDDDIILQAVNAIEGIELPQIRRMHLDGGNVAHVDSQWDEDRARIQPEGAAKPAAPQDSAAPEPAKPTSDDGLSDEDLEVIKPIPRPHRAA